MQVDDWAWHYLKNPPKELFSSSSFAADVEQMLADDQTEDVPPGDAP